MKTLFAFLLLAGISTISKSADFYWVGGSGNYTDFSTHWATTSGGSVLWSQSPSPLDDVYFDANSFTAPGQTVTINATTVYCRNMNWSGITQNARLSGTSSSNTLQVHGSLALSAKLTYSFDGLLQLKSIAKGNTVATSGITLGSNVYFNGVGGEWTLLEDITLSNQKVLYLYAGTLKTNTKNIKAGQVNISAGEKTTDAVRTFDFSNSTITIMNGQFRSAFAYNLTIISNKSTIILEASGGAFIAKADQSFSCKVICMNPVALTQVMTEGCYIDTVIFKGPGAFYNGSPRIGYVRFEKAATLYENGTFNTLIFSGPTVKVQSGTTQTINHDLIASGNPNTPLEISSFTSGAKATFKKISGNICGEFLYLQDINATGGAKFYAGRGSIDLSNNIGWIFQSATPCTSVNTRKSISGVLPVPSQLCSGGTTKVFFSASGNYSLDNLFVAQLSNAAGSFASPTILGSAKTSPINASIQSNLLNGSKYRIRVVATDSSIVGFDNASDLSLEPAVKPGINWVFNPSSVCEVPNLRVTVNYTNAGPNPQTVWKRNSQVISTSNYPVLNLKNSDTVSVTVTSVATCATPVSVTRDSVLKVKGIKPVLSRLSGDSLITDPVNIGTSFVWYHNNNIVQASNSRVHEMLVEGEYKVLLKTDSCVSQFSDPYVFIIAGNSKGGTQYLQNLNIFPNPSDGKHITIDGDYKQIVIRSMSGEKVLEYSAKGSDNSRLDVSSLPKGIYLVTAESEEDKWVSKLIIQ